ncbi:CPBP family intramembrane metalloprotease [Chloroflexales bacterium ZM16-3]|nr:CPBP family intramembrane metalloprotease [Chloroflexales bacterium ZM16-3]
MEEEIIAPPSVPAEGPGFGWRDLGLALLVFVGGSAAVIILARFMASALGLQPGGGMLSPVAYVAGVGLYLALLLGMYLFGARRAGWAALGLRGTSWINFALVPLLFVVGLSALLSVNLLIMRVAGSFENPQVEAISGGRAMSPGELVAGLLLIAVLVPFVEELFFRGMLYPLLRRRLAAPLAVVLNAAIFSAVHAIPVLMPGLFIVGLILAFLRERSGSVWPGMLYHAMQNSLAMLAIYAALNMGAGQ